MQWILQCVAAVVQFCLRCAVGFGAIMQSCVQYSLVVLQRFCRGFADFAALLQCHCNRLNGFESCVGVARFSKVKVHICMQAGSELP